MSIPAPLRRTLYVIAAFLLCLLVTAHPSAADQIYSVTFTGSGTCASGTCNGTAVTGSYLWDATTNAPGGNWSFDTPIGDFSGVGGYPAEPSVDVKYPTQYQSGFNLLDFVSSTDGIQLGFSGNGAFDGSLAATDGIGDILSLALNLPSDSNVFDITSGNAVGTLVSSTPEPSALLLLGLGLATFLMIRRKRGAPATQSARS